MLRVRPWAYHSAEARVTRRATGRGSVLAHPTMMAQTHTTLICHAKGMVGVPGSARPASSLLEASASRCQCCVAPVQPSGVGLASAPQRMSSCEASAAAQREARSACLHKRGCRRHHIREILLRGWHGTSTRLRLFLQQGEQCENLQSCVCVHLHQKQSSV